MPSSDITAAKAANKLRDTFVACAPNDAVSDRSHPPVMFDLPMACSAGSGSLHRLVRLWLLCWLPVGSCLGCRFGRDQGPHPGLANRDARRGTTRLGTTAPASLAETMGNGRSPKSTPSL